MVPLALGLVIGAGSSPVLVATDALLAALPSGSSPVRSRWAG
jgi:hypothetical protein